MNIKPVHGGRKPVLLCAKLLTVDICERLGFLAPRKVSEMSQI